MGHHRQPLLQGAAVVEAGQRVEHGHGRETLPVLVGPGQFLLQLQLAAGNDMGHPVQVALEHQEFVLLVLLGRQVEQASIIPGLDPQAEPLHLLQLLEYQEIPDPPGERGQKDNARQHHQDKILLQILGPGLQNDQPGQGRKHDQKDQEQADLGDHAPGRGKAGHASDDRRPWQVLDHISNAWRLPRPTQ